VGQLYPKSDVTRRSQGFTIFSTGINIGAVLGPIVCGLLAQLYGWHVGFGAAGALMLVAAGVYLFGMRHFEPHRLVDTQGVKAAPLTANERSLLLMLTFTLVLSMFQWLAYDQMFNVGLIWVADHVSLSTPVGAMPAAWFNSVDAGASILVVPLLIMLWQAQARRNTEPPSLSKIGIGAVVMAASMGALALGSWLADSGKVSVIYPLIAFTLSGASFMVTWPVQLAMVSRLAPQSVNALAMAVVYLTAFFSGVGSGYIASYYEPLGATAFWILNAGISLGGTVAVLLFGRALTRRMDDLTGSSIS
jgi:POT family proton-dependent oligopeptide transporter